MAQEENVSLILGGLQTFSIDVCLLQDVVLSRPEAS